VLAALDRLESLSGHHLVSRVQGVGTKQTRPVTIYTVAEHAGVSIATVSRVLQGSVPSSPATRDKVHEAVRAVGYVPLRAGRSTALRLESHGLVLASLAGPYFSGILAGYESTTTEIAQSLRLLSSEAGPDLEVRVRDLAANVDGLVIGQATVSDELVAEVAAKVPTVLLARGRLPGCDSVTVENVESTRLLTEHLLTVHGLRRLLFVGDPRQAPDVWHRYQGFRAAHAAIGAVESVGPLRLPFTEEAGDLAAFLIRDMTEVDGLVCANDELALALWRRLRWLGIRVPQDIAITGWDDVMGSQYMDPGLTTVAQPSREVGRELAMRLHARIIGNDSGVDPVVIPSHVVLRGSCGCRETPSSIDLR
jgi:LacI family transcriptional regulator